MGEMQRLVDIMIDVMQDAPGVGLAAPQIAVPLRVIVLEDRPEFIANAKPAELDARGRVAFDTKVFFNPVLEVIGDDKATFVEGCLSVSGFAAQVERALEVEVTGLDRHANPQTWRVRGWPARILQHECDHLDGTLYLDRMKTRTFMSSERPLAEDDKHIIALRHSLGLP
jgi:peptide deformylase